jgi:hypothetical protein
MRLPFPSLRLLPGGKRMIDVALRYGTNDYAVMKWKAVLWKIPLEADRKFLYYYLFCSADRNIYIK